MNKLKTVLLFLYKYLVVKPIQLLVKYTVYTIVSIVLSFSIVILSWNVWSSHLTKLKQDVPSYSPDKGNLNEIYVKISNATEVTNRVPPILIYASFDSFMSVNAFTTGYGIYFTIAADRLLNEDEKALIMGHEIAHVILHHTDNEYDMFINRYGNEDELMADNLGAVWAAKAGYNVCKGREIYKKFQEWSGNSLNGSHPPNSYRYMNLEHYCKGE